MKILVVMSNAFHNILFISTSLKTNFLSIKKNVFDGLIVKSC